jgi:AcrR family transcriptional regulator
MLYKKGKARREQLIDAALSLLDNQELKTISMHRIAKEAKIPAGSAYHFFANSQEVFAALAERFGTLLNKTITAPYSKHETSSWQYLYTTAIDRAVRIYINTPAYCQIILGPYTPPAIKLSDRENDEQLGGLFASVLYQYFKIPYIPDFSKKVFHSIEIVDLFLSLSFIYHQKLVTNMIDEAKIAAIAYLGYYLPDRIPRKNSI